MDWEREEWKAKALRSRVIDMPFDTPSERVPLADVLERRVWFPHGGVYFLWDGDALQYVGLTDAPLRERLTLAVANGKTWTRANYSEWTVSMQRKPDYPEDKALLLRLQAEHKPPYNVVGRPPRRRGTAGA